MAETNKPTIKPLASTEGKSAVCNTHDTCLVADAHEEYMTCQEHRDLYTTIVYTRGKTQKSTPESNARGTIKVASPEKSCIFDHTISEFIHPLNCAPDWFLNRPLTGRLHIHDLFRDGDHTARLVDLARDIIRDMIKPSEDEEEEEEEEEEDMDALGASLEKHQIVVDFTKVVQETPLLSTKLLDKVPLSAELCGGSKDGGANAQAWTRWREPSDTLLECQHIHHLMIRKGDLMWPSRVADRVRSVFSRIPGFQLKDLDSVCSERYCRDRNALFDLEWSLLTNLETLCLDLRGISEDRSETIEALFVKMGRHLHLKNLVLIGVPQLINFDLVDNEEYVAQQEDDKVVAFPGDEHNPPTDLTNYIHFLKDSLCPGGELRLIVPKGQTDLLPECYVLPADRHQ